MSSSTQSILVIFLPYTLVRSSHYHTKNHKVILNKSWNIGCTRRKSAISVAIFWTKSRIINSLPVIRILTVRDIYNIQSTLLKYKTHRFFRFSFYYSIIEIPWVQTTLDFLSREIKIHFCYAMTRQKLIGLVSNGRQLVLYENTKDDKRIVPLLVEKKYYM
jgi:hypothetical protein